MSYPGHLAPGLIALLIVVVFLIACVVGFMLLAAGAKEDLELADLHDEALFLKLRIEELKRRKLKHSHYQARLNENMAKQMNRERQLDGWRT